MKRLVLDALRLLARRRPRVAFAAAHALVVITRPFGYGIDEGVIASAFPALSPGERRAARGRTWETYLKGEAVAAAMAARGDPTAYPPVVPNRRLDELRPPLILTSFHVGPYQGLAAVLRALPGGVFAVDRGQFAGRGDFELVAGGEDEWSRARTFRRALDALRSGAYVFVNLDAFHPDEWQTATLEARLLGGSIRLARGAFALARLTGTPIVPVVASWRGTKMEVTVGGPIDPTIGEQGMADSAASWIDSYLRERPGEISVFLLDRVAATATR